LSSDFLEVLFSKKDVLAIITEAFAQTISNYTRSKILAGHPRLALRHHDKSVGAAALIRYDGEVFGFEVLITAPKETLFFLYQSAFQEEIAQLTPEVTDLLGEFLNIAFGAIDPPLANKGIKLRSSFPKTLSAQNLAVLKQQGLPKKSIAIDFSAAEKHFLVEIFPLNTFMQKWGYTIK